MTLDDLEQYFKERELPETFQLNSYTKITNCAKFVDNHIAILRANPKKTLYLPYYERLELFKNILNEKY